MRKYRFWGLGIAAAVWIAAGSLNIFAQILPGIASDRSTPIVVSPTQDKFLMMVQPRDVTEIQRDIDTADQLQISAAEAERVAQAQRSAAKSRIDEKNQALSTNKSKLKSAKDAKNHAEILLLQSEGKALERDKKLQEERESLRDAEIDLARKRMELASLMKQAFDLERQLATRRGEQPETSVRGPESARAARVVIDMEKATLEMQKKVADKQGEVADRAKRVVDRQLKTLAAQQNVYSGK